MRYWLCSLLVLVGCQGADHDVDNHSVTQPSIDLEGDWIWTLADDNKLGVAFDGGHYRLFGAGGIPERYDFSIDKLTMEHVQVYDSTGNRAWVDLAWHVAPQGNDSVALTPLWTRDIDLRSDWITAIKPSYLSRITPRNACNPLAIDYLAGWCLGSCPMMRVSIDSTGQVIFNAGDYNWLRGSFSGKLDTSALSELVRRVRSVPESSFGQFYSSSMTDGRTTCIRINLGENNLCACSYGDDEPVELRMLMDAVQNIYHRAALNLVDTAASDERLRAKRGEFCGQLDAMFLP